MARVPAGVHASRMPLPQHERLRRPTGGIRVKQLGEGLTSSGRTVTAASGAAAAAAHASTGEGGPVPLYRRLFFPSNTAERPPRILATPGTEALDVQLYSLLALICRGFITPWYSKISRDRAFFLEIVRIASAVFRRIEAKLVVVPGVSSQNSGHGGEAQTAEVDEGRDDEAASDDNKPKTRAAGPPVDIVRLVFASLPRVLERHVRDYRRAEEEVASASAYGAGIRLPGHHANTHGSAPDASTVPISTLEVLFHSLQPHAAVASSPMFSPHLVETGEGAGSAEKLPPCMNAEYVRALVEALLKEFLPEEDYAAETERSVVREVIVGIILAGVFNKVAQPWFIYNLVVKALEQKPTHPLLERKTATETSREADQPWTARFGSVLANLPILFFRMTAVFASLSLLVTTSLASTRRPPACQQLVAAPIQLGFTFVRAGEGSRQVLDQLRWAALTGTSIASPVLDKVVVHVLHTRILTNLTVSKFLAAVETGLFPGGYPATSVPDPTPDEQIAIQERAYAAVEAAIPASLLPYLMPGVPPEAATKQLAADLLDPFSSQFCNIQLLLFVLDLIVAQLCPNLIVSSPPQG